VRHGRRATMGGMPVWVVLLVAAVACTWAAATLLAKVNPDDPIPVVGSPPVVPVAFVFILGAGVATGWLAGSFASEGALGPWGYLVGALGVLVPWVVVRVRHNRQVG